MEHSLRTISMIEQSIAALSTVKNIEVDKDNKDWNKVYVVPKITSSEVNQGIIDSIEHILSLYLLPKTYSVLPIREGSGIIYSVSF